MEQRFYSIVTDSGTKKVFEAVKNGKKVEITGFAVGDGEGAYYFPKSNQTSLKNEVWRGEITRSTEDENRTLIVESIIPSAVGGFIIREMGLYDRDGDLFAVCNTPDCEKTMTADGVVTELRLKMQIKISNSDAVSLVIKENMVSATLEDIEKSKEEIIEKLKSSMIESVIKADAWMGESEPYSCKLACKGVTDNNNVEIIPGALTLEQYEAMSDAGIIGGTQDTGMITLYAYGNKPNVDLPIKIIVRGD